MLRTTPQAKETRLAFVSAVTTTTHKTKITTTKQILLRRRNDWKLKVANFGSEPQAAHCTFFSDFVAFSGPDLFFFFLWNHLLCRGRKQIKTKLTMLTKATEANETRLALVSTVACDLRFPQKAAAQKHCRCVPLVY